MSAAAEPSEQEEGTIRIPVATFINDVEEFLSSESQIVDIDLTLIHLTFSRNDRLQAHPL